MADVGREARLNFLHAAAHLYSTIAPATSAQLMLRRHTEIAGNSKSKSDEKSSSSCKACGTILIPGWTSQISRVDKRLLQVADPKPQSKGHTRGRTSATLEKHIRVKCLSCHRFDDFPLPKPDTGRTNKDAKATSRAISPSDPKPLLNQELNSHDKPSKASKRRERVRKHKSGLQAMLERSKAPAAPPSGFGLDIWDLMKQG
ncbi:hypothetical protein BDR22DRAFT_841142 [Usnea florida]